MPRIENTFTDCAEPGNAYEYDKWGAFALLIASGGFIGWTAWVLAQAFGGYPCEVAASIIGGLVSGMIIALGDFKSWYYNNRLMCIQTDRCVAGLVVGKPKSACDGDRKIDLVLSPYEYLEVELDFGFQAATNLAASDPNFPAPPMEFQTDRAYRLEYVNGLPDDSSYVPLITSDSNRLSDENRKKYYYEIVHKHMFPTPPTGVEDRVFQKHMHIRLEAEMGNDAFVNSPDDENVDDNPMYRFEREVVPGAGFFGDFFCDFLLGVPSNDEHEPRIVPYIHNEIEGDRLGRGITNFQVTLGTFGVAYIAACIACRAIPVVGQIPMVCEGLAALAAILFAILAWFISKVVNDADDGEAGEISVDVPNPGDLGGDSPTDGVGDLVLAFGRWIMDVEHHKYFEIHPVTAWYRIAISPNGDPREIDDLAELSDVERLLTSRELTEEQLIEMCAMVTRAENDDPEPVLKGSTARMLAMVQGIS